VRPNPNRTRHRKQGALSDTRASHRKNRILRWRNVSATKDMVEFGLGGRNNFRRITQGFGAEVYNNPKLETRGHGCPVCSEANQLCSRMQSKLRRRQSSPTVNPSKHRIAPYAALFWSLRSRECRQVKTLWPEDAIPAMATPKRTARFAARTTAM